MAKLKFDVSGSDPEKASRNFVQPKPGTYRCKIKSAEVTKPEGKDRRIEVQYEVQDKKFKGAILFDYINVESEASVWKLDQFLQAVGIASKKKRKGSLDTTALKGMDVMVRVKGDTYNDDYRAKVGSVFQTSDDEDEDSEDYDEDESDESDEDEEDDEDLAEDDEEEESDEESVDYSEWDITDLRAELKSRKIKIPAKAKKSQLVKLLEKNDEDSNSAFEDDDEDEDEDEE